MDHTFDYLIIYSAPPVELRGLRRAHLVIEIITIIPSPHCIPTLPFRKSDHPLLSYVYASCGHETFLQCQNGRENIRHYE
jgi:hypothetical protein